MVLDVLLDIFPFAVGQAQNISNEGVTRPYVRTQTGGQH